MTYESAMFHRMAEEMQRIACKLEENGEHISDDDIFDVLMSCIQVLNTGEHHLDEVTEAALSIVTLNLGGMGEVLDELPDALDYMLELLMKRDGFVRYVSANGDLIYAKE